MANDEHVAILNQGVEVWNHWRQENPDVRPDLIRTELNGISFGGSMLFGGSYVPAINLSRADLMGADLSNANLIHANLYGANLAAACLQEAELGFARLNQVDLTQADLTRTNLFRTKLVLANLSSAKVDGTLFGWAELGATVLADIDFSKASGLEYALHSAPSYIDFFTIYKSGGNISAAFLHGVGVDDASIKFIQSVATTAAKYYSCFISYSNADRGLAERIYADLQTNNVRCWYAPEDLKIGDRIRQGIDQAIQIHDKLLLLLSRISVDSQWVESEVECALEQEDRTSKLVLLPIRLDDAVMDTDKAWAADIRRKRHIGDFTNWKDHDVYKKAFDQLLRVLKEEA
ncbi:MAG: toll/interleukin-1 receptor domain-containing protein [Chloroflexota bacterium]